MKEEVKNGIIICVCVVLIIVIVYFTISVFFTGEFGLNKNNKSNDNEENLSEESSVLNSSYSNMIIAGKTFEQKEEVYMVLFFSNNETSDSLKSAITSYDSANKDIKLYKVNMDEAINSYVKNDSDNTLPTNSKELKISDNALITISSKNVSSYITDETQIINALK